MDGKRAAPRKGRRVVFAGIRFLCRAGPMCPAEKCVPVGRGTRAPPYGAGALSTRRGRRPDVPSARQRRAGRRIPTPVCTPRALASRRALARNDSASRCLGGQSRPPLQVFIGDSRAGRRTPRAFVPLRSTAGWRFRRNNKTTRRRMRLRVAPIRLTTSRDAGVIAVVPSHS